VGFGKRSVEDLVITTVLSQPLGDVLERSYRGKRVLVTGHNGFVGSWLSYWLAQSGADVVGFALTPEKGGMADCLGLDQLVTSLEIDIRDQSILAASVRSYEPEIVFHLAAQALVLPSFEDPIGTLATNVMGTAHLLEAVRHQPSVRACVVVTSDKCYATAEQAHEESDPFGGDDLYSASKAGAEIVVHAFRSSFLINSPLSIATARAGNIIGGGDWASHRIVPDCVRAILAGEPVRLRQPMSVRPWQHVLDAVAGYLRLGDALLVDGAAVAEGWNFGPFSEATVTVAEVVKMFIKSWRSLGGDAKDPILEAGAAVPERAFLALVSEKARARLGWAPLLDLPSTIAWTAEWYRSAQSQADTARITSSQISQYLAIDAEGRLASTEPDLKSSKGSSPTSPTLRA